jgi:hypothetical protein
MIHYSAMRLITFILLFIYSNAYSSITPIEPAKFTGKGFVISIGVDYYKNYPSLNYAQNDASYFVKSLKRDTGIIELKEYNFRNNATKSQIISAFNEVASKAKGGDLFVFYYSGHSNGQAFFLTEDELEHEEILTYSQNIFCQRQLYVSDSDDGSAFGGKFVQFLKTKPLERIYSRVDRVLISNEATSVESHPGENNRDSTFGGGHLTGSIVNSKFPILSIFKERKKYFWEDYKSDLRQAYANSYFKLDVFVYSEKDYIDELLKNSSRGLGLTNSANEDENKLTIKKGETLSILVGNQNFDQLSRLANVSNDIEKISKILNEKYRTEVISLQDISYGSFADTLIYIANKYQFEEGSQILFFAASHGLKDPVGSGYLCFTDSKINKSLTTSFELNNLKKYITGFGATNTLMIMDICQSSLAFEKSGCQAPSAIEIPLNNPIFNTPFDKYSPAYKNFLNQPTNLYFGSSRDQEAADGAGPNSPFASVIISFLSANNLPVNDSYHLQKSIESNIMHNGSISLPIFCTYNGEADGRFLFIRK